MSLWQRSKALRYTAYLASGIATYGLLWVAYSFLARQEEIEPRIGGYVLLALMLTYPLWVFGLIGPAPRPVRSLVDETIDVPDGVEGDAHVTARLLDVEPVAIAHRPQNVPVPAREVTNES